MTNKTPPRIVKWQRANRDHINTKRRERYAVRGRDPYSAEKYNDTKEYHAARTKRYRVKLKLDMIRAYGGHCSCCGESHSDFLTVDHVNNDGSIHRKTLNGTMALYRAVRDAGYPKDRYTVLCFNCNIARSLFGTCPHKRKD